MEGIGNVLSQVQALGKDIVANSGLAAWVQAIGSLLAVWAAFLIPRIQERGRNLYSRIEFSRWLLPLIENLKRKIQEIHGTPSGELLYKSAMFAEDLLDTFKLIDQIQLTSLPFEEWKPLINELMAWSRASAWKLSVALKGEAIEQPDPVPPNGPTYDADEPKVLDHKAYSYAIRKTIVEIGDAGMPLLETIRRNLMPNKVRLPASPPTPRAKAY